MRKFTVEEINLMCVFDKIESNELINKIGEVVFHLENSDMEELAKQVMDKLHNMNDEEFGEGVLEEAE